MGVPFFLKTQLFDITKYRGRKSDTANVNPHTPKSIITPARKSVLIYILVHDNYCCSGCQNGELKLEEYITHEMKFDKINDAFDLLAAGECLRCVLTF